MRVKRLPILLRLEKGATTALRIANALRTAIAEGRLAPGEALPSTRDLAQQIGVARNTVLEAVAFLASVGAVESKPGVGTFVAAHALPRRKPAPAAAQIPDPTDWARRLPARIGVIDPSDAPFDLRPGVPDLRSIPFDEWRRSASRKMKTLRARLGLYGEPEGDRDLRAEIARYVTRSRSVVCGPDDVVVVSGAQQAFDLIARVLVRPGARVAVEDPGYRPALQAFTAAGAVLSGVPVDAQGMDVGRLPSDATMVYTTPSHQFPLGVTMSDARRAALLAWAARSRAYVVEDDYDSEYRYAGAALPALQSADLEGRVIYVGTFSKNLMPGIRLGYLIAPEPLRRVFVAAKWLIDRHSDNVSQAVLAEFMAGGTFDRHLVRMRKIYAERHAAISGFADAFDARGTTLLHSQAGLHVCLRLAARHDEAQIVAAAARRGIGIYGLRDSFLGEPAYPGLILGFGNLGVREVATAMKRLLAVIAPDEAVSRAGPRA